MALQELPLPVVHLAQDSSREEKRSVALALLLVFTQVAGAVVTSCATETFLHLGQPMPLLGCTRLLQVELMNMTPDTLFSISPTRPPSVCYDHYRCKRGRSHIAVKTTRPVALGVLLFEGNATAMSTLLVQLTAPTNRAPSREEPALQPWKPVQACWNGNPLPLHNVLTTHILIREVPNDGNIDSNVNEAPSQPLPRELPWAPLENTWAPPSAVSVLSGSHMGRWCFASPLLYSFLPHLFTGLLSRFCFLVTDDS